MTMLSTPAEINRFQIAALRGHLKLYRVGMRHSKLTLRQLLACVTTHTNRKYTNRQIDLALTDIEKLLA